MHYAICYVSTIREQISNEEINTLLNFCKFKNNTRNISGILLYSEGNFFQVIEGEKEKVIELYAQITKDTRHRNIIKILERDIYKEPFDGYECEFLAENSYYGKQKFEHYLDYIKVLDQKSQKAVSVIMKAFLKGSV